VRHRRSVTPRALAAALLVLAVLAACQRKPQPDLITLAPASFADLPGWWQDGVGAAVPAFARSCAVLAKRPGETVLGIAGKVADWLPACTALAALDGADNAAARRFFETWFRPWKAGNNGTAAGLFTGYYEPELQGARRRDAEHGTALLRRPPDLIMVELGRFRPAWRGERTAGRVTTGRLEPYETRAEIEAGALDHYHLELLWVTDPVDAFFLQVQGSGRVRLEDGTVVRVGYDGQNGHPYVAIGRLLVERGALTKEKASMQGIRAWIAANPEAGKALMNDNPSFVFFREVPGDGPVGAEGTVLVPGRSLAVDRDFVPLGVPVWLDLDNGGTALRRLVVAQDTGGAIRGPVRGDLFWGFGTEAEAQAGRMRAGGYAYLLLPKTVAPPPPP
jgi:membrane-bound lytic murein transglycosylase A